MGSCKQVTEPPPTTPSPRAPTSLIHHLHTQSFSTLHTPILNCHTSSHSMNLLCCKKPKRAKSPPPDPSQAIGSGPKLARKRSAASRPRISRQTEEFYREGLELLEEEMRARQQFPDQPELEGSRDYTAYRVEDYYDTGGILPAHTYDDDPPELELGSIIGNTTSGPSTNGLLSRRV